MGEGAELLEAPEGNLDVTRGRSRCGWQGMLGDLAVTWGREERRMGSQEQVGPTPSPMNQNSTCDCMTSAMGHGVATFSWEPTTMQLCQLAEPRGQKSGHQPHTPGQGCEIQQQLWGSLAAPFNT